VSITTIYKTKRKRDNLLARYKPLTSWKLSEREALKKKVLEYIERLINES